MPPGAPAEDLYPPEPPLAPEGNYVDEEGRTITVYPARFAVGGGLQPFTARPRRRE